MSPKAPRGTLRVFAQSVTLTVRRLATRPGTRSQSNVAARLRRSSMPIERNGRQGLPSSMSSPVAMSTGRFASVG